MIDSAQQHQRRMGQLNNGTYLSEYCPTCSCPYDNNKKKAIMDQTCSHRRCLACMKINRYCALCLLESTSSSTASSSDNYYNVAQTLRASQHQLLSPSSSTASSGIISSPYKQCMVGKITKSVSIPASASRVAVAKENEKAETIEHTQSQKKQRSRLKTNGNLLLRSSKSAIQIENYDTVQPMSQIDDGVEPPSPSVAHHELMKQLNSFLFFKKLSSVPSTPMIKTPITPIKSLISQFVAPQKSTVESSSEVYEFKSKFERFLHEINESLECKYLTNSIYLFDECLLYDEFDQNFVGRKWLFDELECFISDHLSRFFVIEGICGSGKTRICEEILTGERFSKTLLYIHFCRSDNEQSVRANVFLKNLIKILYSNGQKHKLCAYYNSYINKNHHLIENYFYLDSDEEICEFLTSELLLQLSNKQYYLFEKLVIEPLNEINNDNSNYLIVIDSFEACFNRQLERCFFDYSDLLDTDENYDNTKEVNENAGEIDPGILLNCADSDIEVNNLGLFLIRNVNKFPKNFKFLFTMRSNVKFRSKFRKTKFYQTYLEFKKHISLLRVDLNTNLNSKFDLNQFVQIKITESIELRKNLFYFQTIDAAEMSSTNDIVANGVLNKCELNFQSKFIDYLLVTSRLNYLYVSLILKLIKCNLIQIKTLKFNVLPKTLNELFQLIFNLKFTVNHNKLKADMKANEKQLKYLNEINIILICLISMKPLQYADLYEILTQRELINHDNYYEELLNSLEQDFFLNGRLRFRYLGLRDWLLDKLLFKSVPSNSTSNLQFRKFNIKFGHYLLTLYLYKKLALEINKVNVKLQSHDIAPKHDCGQLIITYQSDIDRDLLNLFKYILQFLSHLLNSTFDLKSKNYFFQLIYTALALKGSKTLLYAFKYIFLNPEFLLNMPNREILLFLNQLFNYKFGSIYYTELKTSVCEQTYVKVPVIYIFACYNYHNLLKCFEKAELRFLNFFNKRNLLSYACEYNAYDCGMLTTSVESITQLDVLNQCAPLYAAKYGYIDIVELIFCKYNWQLEKSTESDWVKLKSTLLLQTLIVSIIYNQYNLVDYLVENFIINSVIEGVNVNHVDTYKGETALTCACTYGHLNICKLLIEKANASLIHKNSKSLTPLLCAIKSNEWKLIEYLINTYLIDQVTLEQQFDKHGRNALMIASSEGHLVVIDILIEKGFNLNAQDCEGLTALHWASLKGHYNAVINLLNNGANVSQVDFSGRTPLDLATFYGDCRLVQLLIDRGAIIEHVDNIGIRPIDRAIGCNNRDVVLCFLKKGAKLCPTTWAMACGKPGMIIILLNKLIEDGNTLYKKGLYMDALHRYTYALKKFPNQNTLNLPTQMQQQKFHFQTDSFYLNVEQTLIEFKFNLYLNLSRCQRKLNNYENSIEFCNKALSIKSNSYEAYYARARAKRDNMQFESALNDLYEAEMLCPKNPDIKKLINKIKDDIKVQHNQLKFSKTEEQQAYGTQSISPTPSATINTTLLKPKKQVLITKFENNNQIENGSLKLNHEYKEETNL